MNKFVYKIRTVPPEIKQAWTQIKKTRDNETRAAFIQEVLKVGKRGSSDAAMAVATSSMRVTDSKTDQDEEKWISWKKIVDEEGEQQVHSMIAHGTITYKLNPRLALSEDIKFPENQVFWYTTTVTQKRKTVANDYEIKGEATVDKDASAEILNTLASVDQKSLTDTQAQAQILEFLVRRVW